MQQKGMFQLPELTLSSLKANVKEFADELSVREISELYGTTDGKAVGTYIEQMFRSHLSKLFHFKAGNSASGIDIPELRVDLKATSITQPQSSCPFKSASQKVYGLGYNLMIFVYDKKDNAIEHNAVLNILHAVFVDQTRTADYQTTTGIAGILDRHGNSDDLVAYFEERNLPLDEIGRQDLANRVLKDRPLIGYLTISNALQWRLQYSRVIDKAGKAEGVENVRV